MKLKSLVTKRSIIIDSHKTSLSLEDDFWKALKGIARGRGETLSYLVGSIDANRQFANLSSALRIFVLRHYMDQSARQRELFQQRTITI
jgi:predicted DNA-binding ribbon-helix-helix protein